MKVLVAHNQYRSDVPSGENQAVQAEVRLLTEAGIGVVPLSRNSDSIGEAGLATRLTLPVSPLYSRKAITETRALIRRHRPDVMHVHNVFPLLSPSIVNVASDMGVPVVQTVHNFRHTCVNGLHFRDGHTCTDCVGHAIPWPAVEHGCYRSSRLQTVPMALSQPVHRKTWNRAAAFLALTPFMADRLVSSGISRERVHVRPSWVPDLGLSDDLGEDLLFVGRLEESKGLGLLLDAWRLRTHHRPDGGLRDLIIVGDGPLRDHVMSAAAQDSSIKYAGRLPPEVVAGQLRSSCALVVPSLCFEGFPLVIAEAFSTGRPVITVTGGSAATIISDDVGWRCEPAAGALADLIAGVRREDASQKGRSARAVYENYHSPQAALDSLLSVYEEVACGA